jgi:DNA-binding transcriptional LysR family regulator
VNTLHFKYAVEVERTGSITQAADNLYMAQPNLSKAIKELEETLGIQIFERTSKGVVPTSKGSEFLIYANNILRQLEKMESLNLPDSSQYQRFCISIPRGSYIASGVTNFIANLDLEKGIDIHVQETNSVQAINNIVDGSYNLGIIRYKIEYEKYFLDYLAEKEIAYDLIWEFDSLVLMSQKHPLATLEKLQSRDLKGYIEIVHGDITVPYLPLDEIRKLSGTNSAMKKIYVYDRCSQFDMLTHIPTTYMWVSPIPKEWLERYDLVQRKCGTHAHKYKDMLVYQKDYTLSDLEMKFMNQLYESKNGVTFQKYK